MRDPMSPTDDTMVMHADAPAKKVNMADAESPHRSVRTDSQQRIVYGISIAIVGGELRQRRHTSSSIASCHTSAPCVFTETSIFMHVPVQFQSH